MTVYLDHNATAPMLPETLEVLRSGLGTETGNPSSLHGPGRESARLLDEARRTVAGVLGVHPDEIVFTGSGTESVITAVLGSARGRAGSGGHVVLSAIEHAAGIAAGRQLEREGWDVTWVAPDEEGSVDSSRLARLVRPETALVSVLHANNETGVIQPIEEIAAACRDLAVPFHTDAVQSAGKIPVRPDALGVDLLSLAGHKFGGPKGIGVLWVRRGVRLEPLLPGAQEGGRRGGTAAPLLALGLAEALRVAERDRLTHGERLRDLRDRLEDAVCAALDGVRVSGRAGTRLPNTSHFTFPEEVGGDLVPALDLEGYAVSAGSACASGSTEPSPVLLAMGMSPQRARTAVRVSLGPRTLPGELEGFVEALQRVVSRAWTAGSGRS